MEKHSNIYVKISYTPLNLLMCLRKRTKIKVTIYSSCVHTRYWTPILFSNSI